MQRRRKATRRDAAPRQVNTAQSGRRSDLVMKRLLAILTAAFVLASAAGLSAYLLIAREVSRERVEAMLSSHFGGTVHLAAAPRISLLQGPSLEIEDLRLEGRDGRWTVEADRLVSNIEPARLFFGEVLLSSHLLEGARLHFDGLDLAPASLAGLGEDLTRLIEAQVAIAGGEVSWGDTRQPRLVDLSLRLNPTVEGGSIRGSLMAGDQKVEFSASLGNRGTLTGRASGPVAVSIASPLAAFRMNGALRNPDAARLEGTFEFSTSDFRGLSIRFGRALVGEASFGALRIGGQGAVDLSRLVLDTARLELDGNVGEGRLGFELGEKRPRLEGTLAFESFDLSAYLGELQGIAGLAVASGDKGANSLRQRPLAGFLRAGDIDLRLSTAKFVTAGLSGGPSAISLLLRDGDLTVDLSETMVAGGVLDGAARLKPVGGGGEDFDFSANVVVEAVDTRQLTGFARVSLPDTGRLSLRIDRSGRGETLAAILASAGGEVELALEKASFPAGGEVLGRLLSDGQAASGSSSGSGPGSGATPLVVERLSAKARVEEGDLRLAEVEVLTGQQVLQAGGRMSLTDLALSLRGRLAPRLAGTQPDAAAIAEAGMPVLVRGTLAQPSLLPDLTGVGSPSQR